MTEAPEQQQVGKAIATQTPWVMIAVLVHVVGIAIASIMYYAHESPVDLSTPTEIRVAAPAEKVEDIQPPTIQDREEVPKLKDQDIQPSDLTEFNPEADNDPEHGDPTDPNSTSELTNLPSGDTTGGSAIGVNGPGHFGIAPSATGGRKLGGNKYGSRFGHGKGVGGAGGRVNEAVTAGLEWLRKHQDEDGRWDAAKFMKHDKDGGEPCGGPGNPVNDVGVTGLALLAFLGEGNTLKLGTYRAQVRKGIKWLIEQQGENGLIGQNSSATFAYGHAIATVALCEAYGLSEHRPYKVYAQNAINYIVNARNPYGVWRYQPREVDGDTSITGWMVQALLSAEAFELTVDQTALKNAMIFFESVTDPNTGAAGYQKPGEGSSRPVGKQDTFPAAKTESLTGVVVLCRYLMHQDPKDTPIMNKSQDTILAKLPTWNEKDGSIDMYYWYYASYAMFQASGKYWAKWSTALTKAAVDTQKKNGNEKGSWDPVDPWGEEGGRVYSTAIMVLCLEAYYRYGKLSFTK
jgi:hypothetical protein